jgi:UrcA family protein
MKIAPLPSALCGLFAAVAMTGVAVPASAQDYQDTQEDVIVNGHWGRVPDDVQSLSQHVSYADLDLSYAQDRAELRHRISLTARYLCDRLGEPEGGSIVQPDCREAAVRDALSRVGTIEAHFAPRGTGWTRSRWEAPYPASWEQQYP